MDVYQLARLGPIQFVCCERSGRQQANKLRKLEASRIYQKRGRRERPCFCHSSALSPRPEMDISLFRERGYSECAPANDFAFRANMEMQL
jgi:hypothetical protein